MSRKTALFRKHVEGGAKMVEFAGFEMPIHYRSVLEEHRNVRSNAGLFDVSHMGEIEVKGPGAASFVQRMTTNDVLRLQPGMVQYSTMCLEDGGIIDDLLVYRQEESFMLVVNGANRDGNMEWLKSHTDDSVTVSDISDDIALLALQGPQSRSVLEKLTDADLENLNYYRFVTGQVAGVDLLISRTGYTGELGYELYFRSDIEKAELLWDELMTAGETFGLLPTGLGARDTLRLEMGFCLYGNDIDRSTTPLEAGLGWITRLAKGEFIGSEALRQLKEEGVTRKLVGFTIEGRGFPRKGYQICSGGQEIGAVTSGTFSPTLELGIGMGYIPSHHAASGEEIEIRIRERLIPAQVVDLPFVNKKKP